MKPKLFLIILFSSLLISCGPRAKEKAAAKQEERQKAIMDKIVLANKESLEKYYAYNDSVRKVDNDSVRKVDKETKTRPKLTNELAKEHTTASDSPQDEFKKWLLENTAVIEVHYESDYQIWVYLQPSKYTSEANVELIAKDIARWYAKKMNKDFAICTVWQGSRVYAKGNSN